MKKMTYIGLLGASTVLCLSFFQNCSKIATADLAAPVPGEKVLANGQAVSTVPRASSLEQPGVKAPIIEHQAIETNTIVNSHARPDDVKAPVAPRVEQTEVEAVVKVPSAPKVDDSQAKMPKGPELSDTLVQAPTPPKDNLCKAGDTDCVKRNREEVAAIAACLKSSKSSMGSNGSIHHISGLVELSVTNQNASIHHLEALIARAATGVSRGYIEEIHHVTGDVLLCNIDIDSIHDVGGNVTLVNSSVRKIQKIVGSIKEVAN